MAYEIILGVSLFSMGYEYASGKLDLEGCIRAARSLGYTGFELVSAQMVPGYPAPTDHGHCSPVRLSHFKGQ